MDAALKLLDAEGIEALTMRRLAEVLGTSHTSLYRHVTSRDELLVQMVDHVLGELRPADPSLGFPAQAEWTAYELRRVMRAHPAIVPLLTSGRLLGPNAMLGRERTLALLLGHGLEARSAAHAYLLIAHYVIGSALLESTGAGRSRPERHAMATLLQHLPPHAYPAVVNNANHLNEPDSDAEFAFGLRIILEGIERNRVSPGTRAPRGRTT